MLNSVGLDASGGCLSPINAGFQINAPDVTAVDDDVESMTSSMFEDYVDQTNADFDRYHLRPPCYVYELTYDDERHQLYGVELLSTDIRYQFDEVTGNHSERRTIAQLEVAGFD